MRLLNLVLRLALILFLGTLFSCNGGTKEIKEIILLKLDDNGER